MSNGDGTVVISEIITLVNIAIGTDASGCERRPETITIEYLISAVRRALFGC